MRLNRMQRNTQSNHRKHLTLGKELTAEFNPTGYSRKFLDKLEGVALQKFEVWPEQLFNAVDAGNLVGKGLLLSVVDARGAQEADARLQTPILTNPLMAPLCKELQKHPLVIECAKHLRAYLPRKAASGFQFVPTDLWKGRIEKDVFGVRLARESLKSTTTLIKLTIFLFPPVDAATRAERDQDDEQLLLAESIIARPGATLPLKLLAVISQEDKARIWEHMTWGDTSCEDGLDIFLGLFGLDRGVLQGDPLFVDFMTAFTAHLDSWRSGGEIKQTMLLKAWCPGADVLMDEAVAFKHYLFDFFDDNLDMLVALRLRMGVERATECARTAFAYFDHRAECQARYTADFHNQLARPCPACGKPQDVNHGYACACQGPELPRAPQNTANQNAKETMTPTVTAPSLRRNKNVQTAFQPLCTKRQACCPKKHVANAAPQAAASQSTPRVPSKGHATGEQKKKKCKETDLAMIRLRDLSSRRTHVGQAEEDHIDSQAATSRSRRSRRSMPQGDPKLARLLAAGEVFCQEELEQPSDAADAD